MRCRQTVKLIGEVNQSVGKPTKILERERRRNGSSPIHCKSMRSLPSHNKENLTTSTANVLLINLRVWKKIPGTLQRNTRPKAYYFNDTLSRDSELDAMNATDN